jgi:formamidopyrimidine-DNA glycosylase
MRRRVDIARVRAARVGASIERVRRLGKYLLIDFERRDQSVLVHLGMTGRLRLVPARLARAPHTHVVWSLSGGRELRFSDPRRFGQVALAARDPLRVHPALAKLGVDPLSGELTGALLHRTARSRRSQLKVMLLDQRVIAGVGNIYASEALWVAGIPPTLRSNRLSRARADRLAEAVVKVLRHALLHGGTSLRDFVDADGMEGENADYLSVYGREGEPCPRCQAPIRRTVIQGRATFSCQRCQRA